MFDFLFVVHKLHADNMIRPDMHCWGLCGDDGGAVPITADSFPRSITESLTALIFGIASN